MKKSVVAGLKNILPLLVILILFVSVSYVVRLYDGPIEVAMGDYVLWGVLLFLILTALSVVVPVLPAIALIPLAVTLWGWPATGLLSIAGWLMGSIIVFALVRRWGRPGVQKLFPLKRIEQIENLLPSGEVFWGLVVIRMALPVNVLSYALSLFTPIRFRTFALTTAIGITPFAFVWAYVGTLPLLFQIIGILGGVGVVSLWILTAMRRRARGA